MKIDIDLTLEELQQLRSAERLYTEDIFYYAGDRSEKLHDILIKLNKAIKKSQKEKE